MPQLRVGLAFAVEHGRPGPPPSRLALLRATSSGVLDRALDVAAALEVRGYGSVRKPPRSRRPYNRHDVAFYGAAVAVLALAVGARIADLAPFGAYPSLHAGAGVSVAFVALALPLCASAPFADRRGVGPP